MKTVIGVDAGGTRIKAALVDENGRISNEKEVATPRKRISFEQAIQRLIREVGRGGDFEAIGFASKGAIRDKTVVWQPEPFRFLEGLSYQEIAHKVFPGVPVYVENDARVALIGEMVWGAAKGKRDVLMLTVGTAIGGAVLVNGTILSGSHGSAGHLGHVVINPSGEKCGCGNTGCLQAQFSATALERRIRKRLTQGTDLARYFPVKLDKITAKDVFDEARRGNELALSVVEEGIRSFAIGIANFVRIFDPEVVIIGGQVAEAGDTLMTPLRDQVWSRTKDLAEEKIPVVFAQTGTSGIRGAAALALSG